jgi:hypothetical protein
MFFVWPVPIFLGAAAALIVVAMLGRRLFPGTYVSQRAFWCPFRRTNVRVHFRESVWDRSVVGIEACSAVSPPLECEKGCLFLAKFPPVQEEITPIAH